MAQVNLEIVLPLFPQKRQLPPQAVHLVLRAHQVIRQIQRRQHRRRVCRNPPGTHRLRHLPVNIRRHPVQMLRRIRRNKGVVLPRHPNRRFLLLHVFAPTKYRRSPAVSAASAPASLYDSQMRMRQDAQANWEIVLHLLERIGLPEGFHADGLHHLRFKGLIAHVALDADNRIRHVHAFQHLAERRVLAVEVRAVRSHDEELTAGGIRHHAARHRQNAVGVLERVVHAVHGKFTLDVVAGAADARALGIAALNHEAGDAAVEEALYLTKFARKVTIIHRRDELRAAKSIQEKAFANPKITFLWDSVVEEVGGDGLLQTMTVKNVKTGELTKIEADPKDGLFGLFGFIGMIPNIGVFADKVETDDKGYIKTDEDMHTNVPGVYAVGDVRVKSLRQVVTAVADGAIAAVQVERSMSDY